MTYPWAIPITSAHVCLDCDCITNTAQWCPSCGNSSLWPLAAWMQRKAEEKREEAA